ncbi:MAG: hypothetical protein WCP97_07865 [bacterium]
MRNKLTIFLCIAIMMGIGAFAFAEQKIPMEITWKNITTVAQIDTSDVQHIDHSLKRVGPNGDVFLSEVQQYKGQDQKNHTRTVILRYDKDGKEESKEILPEERILDFQVDSNNQINAITLDGVFIKGKERIPMQSSITDATIILEEDDTPHLCYFGVKNDINYATLQSGVWKTEVIDSGVVPENYSFTTYCSIQIDRKKTPHVSYENATVKRLKYATKNIAGHWNAAIVDAQTRAVGGNSIQLDNLGNPIIAYTEKIIGDPGNIKLAKKMSSNWVLEIPKTEGILSSFMVDGNNTYYFLLGSYNNDGDSLVVAPDGQWGNAFTAAMFNKVQRDFSIASVGNGKILITYRDLQSKKVVVDQGLISSSGNDYQAQWLSQTPSNIQCLKAPCDEYFHVKPGDTVDFETKFKNTGNTTWINTGDNEVSIAIYKDTKVQSGPFSSCYSNPSPSCSGKGKFGESYFYDSSWHTVNRLATLIEPEVKPGETATFKMKFKIPVDAMSGRYREDITLAYGKEWMDNFINGDSINKAHIWVGFEVDDQVFPANGVRVKIRATNDLSVVMDVDGVKKAIIITKDSEAMYVVSKKISINSRQGKSLFVQVNNDPEIAMTDVRVLEITCSNEAGKYIVTHS